MTNCDFALLPCPNRCKDGDKLLELMRKDIENHKKEVCLRRKYECPHCKESGEYQEMTTKHLEECPKMEIPCPNDGCDEEIKRCDISKHRQICQYERVSCMFANIGCKEKINRKDLQEHEENSQQHLHVAIVNMQQQQVTIKEQEEKIVLLQSKIIELLYNIDKLKSNPLLYNTFKFKVTEFDNHKQSNDSFYSPPFYSSRGGYKMCVIVVCYGYGDGLGTHVSVFASLMRGENDDHLPWPFAGTITFELLNQLEDRSHHSEEIQFPTDDEASQRVVNEEQSEKGYGRPCFIPHSDLGYDSDNNRQYLEDDCLYFRVNVHTKSTSKPWLVL